MLVSLTVGKVDAGVTVLLTPDKRLVGGLLELPGSDSFPLGVNMSPIADNLSAVARCILSFTC